MQIQMDTSWKTHLNESFDAPYFKSLMAFVEEEYSHYSCFPEQQNIFNAFNLCAFEDLKVVIIGQDPYHDVGQANGLCFSVHDGIAIPPSLKNIYKELENDLGNVVSKNGNLESWGKQGVLLLNATLTVRAHQAGSHQKKGWEIFTDTVIKLISDKKENVVFLLWGGFAKKKAKHVDTNKHYIFTCGHPSPLSANRGYWFGNKHFSKTNYQLEQVGLQPLVW